MRVLARVCAVSVCASKLLRAQGSAFKCGRLLVKADGLCANVVLHRRHTALQRRFVSAANDHVVKSIKNTYAFDNF